MIIRKSAEELALMKHAGQIVARVLNELGNISQPGVSTKKLDDLAYKIIKGAGAEPAFLGYKGFPSSICTSINEQVVHGIPGKRVLKEGDLLSIDVGVKHEGYYADAAVSVGIGETDREVQNLAKVARAALYDGIEYVRAGNHLHDISAAIQRRAESHDYSVVRDFVGHGIGQKMHEDPQIPNFGEAGTGSVLKEGMVLALEPMVNNGGFDVRILEDKWTVVTADSKLSAHFEHTVAVTSEGPEILTAL